MLSVWGSVSVRLTERSALHRPGPLNALRPVLPRTPAAGRANAAGFSRTTEPVVAGIPDTALTCVGASRFARWLTMLPVEGASTLNGNPVRRAETPDKRQPRV